jgi:hypothetical protein
MARQEAVTLHAELLSGHERAAVQLLEGWSADPRDGGPDFSALGRVHFARLFVLEPSTDLDGAPLPASVVYMADVDGSPHRHLRELVAVAAADLDLLFAHCLDYPAHPDDAARLAWLRARTLRPAAYYVHTMGRTVAQVRDEAYLRAQLEDEVDTRRGDGASADRIATELREHVRERGDLAWALRPAAGPGLAFRLRRLLEMTAGATALLITLPLLLPVLAVWILLLRLLEKEDTQEHGDVDVVHVDAVRRYEDVVVQNAFTGVGLIKPGPVRRTTMRVALFGLDAVNRLVFARDNLAGVRSIHFARWQPIDGGRRLIFASSYDGSLESYMDDFISRLYWGVNLVFGNGMGFPRTRWVFWGGAKNEISYKHYLRRHLVPTVVFYSAYPDLPAANADRNAELRAGLVGADNSRWLDLL